MRLCLRVLANAVGAHDRWNASATQPNLRAVGDTLGRITLALSKIAMGAPAYAASCRR